MDIKHITSSTYSVHEVHKGKYQLVKVIGEYDGKSGKKEAYEDMVNIFNKEITENDVEMKWRNRE